MSAIGDALRRAWQAVLARRTAWMVAGALAFGAFAVLGARNYIGERLALERARLQPRHEMVDVVVARRDLRRGDAVNAETMAVRSMPREYAPGAAVVPARFDALAGARLQVAMRSGEPLMASAVAMAEAAPISSRIRPGIRAMTIAVDEVNSLSGMLQPGDRIDLLLSVRPAAAGGLPQPEITRTVMQGVQVMATGRQSRAMPGDEIPSGRPFTSITVEVDPDQAQRLVVAQRAGRLTAVLRNPEDLGQVGERRLDVNALLGLPAPTLAAGPAPAPPPPPPRTVEVIVGGRGQVGVPGAAVQGAVVPGAVAPVAPGAAGPGAVMPNAVLPGIAGAGAAPGAAPAAAASRADPQAPLPEGVWIPVPPPATVPLYR